LSGVGITTPVEGDLLTYNGTSWVNGVPAGSILQVVSTTKTDTYSESLGTGVTSTNVVTGLTATITPSSTDSKILVRVSVHLSNSTQYGEGGFVIRRGATAIGISDASGSRPRLSAQAGVVSKNSSDVVLLSIEFLDSPATTSEIVYGISVHNGDTQTETVYVNRSSANINSSRFSNPPSVITLMEVAG